MANEGILTQISIGKESSLNTAVVPDVSIAVLPSDGVVTEEEAVGVPGIDTSPGLHKAFVQGLRSYSGSFEMNAYPEALGYFILSALGDVTSGTAAGESAVYDHAFAETVAKESLTIEQKIGSIVERIAGFVVSSFTLHLAVGEPIRITVEGQGMSKASASAITAAYETSKVFDWTDVQSISIGGTDVKSAISEMSITYTNNLGMFHGLQGDSDPAQQYVGNSEVTATLTAYLTSDMKNLQAVFEAKTEQAVIVTITADETIGSAENNEIVITVPKMVINAYSYPIDTDYVEVSADLVARQDPSSGLITVDMVNEVASY